MGSHKLTNAQQINISLSAMLMSAPSALMKFIGRVPPIWCTFAL